MVKTLQRHHTALHHASLGYELGDLLILGEAGERRKGGRRAEVCG